MESNLPPGVTESIIPGNSLEDIEWDEFSDWAMNQLNESQFNIRQARRAVLIGIAAVIAEEDEIREGMKEVRTKERLSTLVSFIDKTDMPQDGSNCPIKPVFKDAKIAFEEAITANRLSRNPEDRNFAGRYMYMHTNPVTGKDHFKNLITREYDV